MIAIESFKKFRIIDFLAIIILVLLWFLFSKIINNNFNATTTYFLSLLIITILMSFTAHLVRKAGSVTIFYFIGALFTSNLNNLGITGINKIIVFVIAGIVFELVFLILKIEIKNIKIDIISGVAISSAIIPLMIAFLLSPEAALNMIIPIFNLVLLSFFIGIIGSIISFLIWYHLKTTKLILKFEYSI